MRPTLREGTTMGHLKRNRLKLALSAIALALVGFIAGKDLLRIGRAMPVVDLIPPLSSALHVLPPVGNSRPIPKDLFDDSLLESLMVWSCKVTGPSSCEPVGQFTGTQSKRGHASIRLQDWQYHLNWKVPKERARRGFQIHFSVAALELGWVAYSGAGGRTVPIKFSVANHPSIRARVLHERGLTASQIATELLSEFSLGAQPTAHVLSDEGISAPDTASALRDVFAVSDPPTVAQILAAAGYPPGELALALRDVLGVDVLAVADILLKLGYPAPEIAQLLAEAFILSALETAQLLDQLGFSVIEIATALRDFFDLDALGVVQTLQSINIDALDVGMVLRDIFDLAALDAFSLLRALGYSEDDNQLVLLNVYDTYAAIVDVKVTRNNDQYDLSLADEGYTAVSFFGNETCTEPYVAEPANGGLRDVLGSQLYPCTTCENQDFDVNRGIGGDFVIIWAKYELLSADATTKVLTGVKAKHWEGGGWQVHCPEGWEPDQDHIWDLALTTRTKGSCWRIGLCVHYEPFNEAQIFISNLSLSRTHDGFLDSCPAFCESNLGTWPMHPDRSPRTTGTWNDIQSGSGDIHRGCGGPFVRLCYNEARRWPAMPPSIGEFDDDEKRELLVKYAPRVFLSDLVGGDQDYFPASVEWTFSKLRDPPDDPEGKGVVLERRVECFGTAEVQRRLGQSCWPEVIEGYRQWGACTQEPTSGPWCPSGQWLEEPEERWWLYPKDLPGSPSARLPFYYGCNRDQLDASSANRNDCGLGDVPIYSFWHPHPLRRDEQSLDEVVDLVYFLYFPYNRGKSCVNTRWENHVGDWEAVSVRLSWQWSEEEGWLLKPVQVHMGAHSFGHRRNWSDEHSNVTDVTTTVEPIEVNGPRTAAYVLEVPWWWAQAADDLFVQHIDASNIVTVWTLGVEYDYTPPMHFPPDEPGTLTAVALLGDLAAGEKLRVTVPPTSPYCAPVGIYTGIEKEGTHPVAHVASEGNGLWPDCGDDWEGKPCAFCRTQYGSAAGCGLTDEYAKGTRWETWKRVEAFDWSTKRGLGLLVEGQLVTGEGFCAHAFPGSFPACDEVGWPNWLVSVNDVGNGIGDEDPWSGPIWRWGTEKFECWFGACRMTVGPTGPVDKGLWSSDVLD
jgi:hypothetical protein